MFDLYLFVDLDSVALKGDILFKGDIIILVFSGCNNTRRDYLVVALGFYE